MNKLQRIIILLWAVVLGTIARSVVAAGLLLGAREGADRLTQPNKCEQPCQNTLPWIISFSLGANAFSQGLF
jgi:hypothetical protein